jgi:peptide/nickel transport system substrate-binding protein
MEEEMYTRVRKFMTVISLMAVGVLVFAACAPATPAAQPTTVSPTTAPAATSAPGATSAPTTSAPQPTTAPTTSAATPPTTGGGTVKNPGTIVYATISDPESLDPAWEYDTASQAVVINVYETLLFPDKTSTTQFVPLLATKWTISPDGKTYTFDIRQGVKFQDGQDLTPQDVAYSFWRGMIQDRAGGPQWIMLQPFFGLDVQSFEGDVVTKQFNGNWVNAVKAVEQAVTYDNAAGTVTLHLKQPYGPMLQILTGTWADIVSMPWVIQQGGWNGDPTTAQKYHDPAANQDELFKVMNGTGPYMLQRWLPNDQVDLTANPNYWVKTPLWSGGPTGPASIKNVVFKTVTEWGTRFAMLKTGDADIAYVPTQYQSQAAPLVQQTCNADSQCTPTNSNGTLLQYTKLPSVQEDVIFLNENVNTTGGNNTLGSGKLDGNGIPADFFSDPHIRKAFNYAFDWNTFISQVWNGQAQQGLGPIINGELGYDPNQAHYTYDPAKAAAEFQASTLKSPDGKSLWDTGFYMQYIYNSGNSQRQVAGQILQADLAKINPKFRISIVDEPFPVFLKDQVAGRMPLFMLGWLEDYHDPQDWVVPFLASGGTYAASQAFPKDVQAQMDQLITQGVETTDTQARAKIYGQLQNLAYENALDIFVEQPELNVYMQNWVKGYYYNPIFGNVVYYFYALSKGG